MAKQRDFVKTPPLPIFFSELERQDPPLSDVTLVVSTADILLTTVTLPKLNRQRLIQALPYALEDGLIDDVNRLHFATGPRMADGTWPVAVVAKAKMQAWMDKVQEAGISLSCLIPDICAVPMAPDCWFIDVTDTDCVARTGTLSGFSCHRDNLATYIESALTETKSRPHLLHLRYFSTKPNLNLPAWPDIQVETTRLSPADRAALAQKAIIAAPLVNLLQNEWRQDTFLGGQSEKRLLKTALGLMTLSAIIFFFTHIAALIVLQQEANQLKSSIRSLYFRHFPTATSMVAPKARFSEKLRRLGGENNSGRFSTLLAKAANPLASQPEIRSEWMDYRNHQLQVGLTAPSFDSLDTLVKALTATGLTVHQQTAASHNGMIQATLLIRSSA